MDPSLSEHALATVQAVMKSDIWWRAQASPHRLVEVPFQMSLPPDPAIPESVPTIVRGVVDLVFREGNGWVIVDYKTDARPESELPQLIERYRGQVETYANFWKTATGQPVAEIGLYFTCAGLYVRT